MCCHVSSCSCFFLCIFSSVQSMLSITLNYFIITMIPAHLFFISCMYVSCLVSPVLFQIVFCSSKYFPMIIPSICSSTCSLPVLFPAFLCSHPVPSLSVRFLTCLPYSCALSVLSPLACSTLPPINLTCPLAVPLLPCLALLTCACLTQK